MNATLSISISYYGVSTFLQNKFSTVLVLSKVFFLIVSLFLSKQGKMTLKKVVKYIMVVYVYGLEYIVVKRVCFICIYYI
jgi:hypothetical protein